MTLDRSLILALALLQGSIAISGAEDAPGHSRHGTAFDSGLRQRPWRMEGIGHSHFPITTKVPEVQEWFDQGNTLLHSFWVEEAERSFRWCLKLDPECAMAYWGLARTGLNWSTRGPLDTPKLRRYLDFLNEAIRRQNTVSPRERMFIEAWAAAFTGAAKDRGKLLARELQRLVLKFPDDIEAKALFALFSIESGNALGTELVLRQVLEQEPDHPGAHHYRIHNWDGVAPEQGLLSCQRYGMVAPNVGHADHMPGHNYSKMGLWHEAARSMDTAARVELRYMNERLALPFEDENYPHNRNYLCYIQEQLGLEEAALQGARELLAAPRDPESNKDNNYGAFEQGMTALVRTLLKFERWDDVLFVSNSAAIPWRDLPSDKDLRAFAETLAFTGKGNLVNARSRLQDLKTSIRHQAEKAKEVGAPWAIGLRAAEGLLRAAEGDILDATRHLTEAAALEKSERDAGNYDDPPTHPWPVNRVLGDVYLNRGEHRLAIEAYQRALAQEPNEAFSLSGLARAHFGLGEREKAERFYGRLLYVWSGANPRLKWIKSIEALGLKATPVAETLVPERPYRPETLAQLGPINWEPYAAPRLSCLDVNGERVSLEDFRGSNVLLIFYLSDECVHCVEQLVAINARAADWSSENTVVLGVSSASPEKNKTSAKLGKLAMRQLSDHDHENARRFASYDDFEEMELHSTLLIDANGRVHWKRTGGKPFADLEFLLQSAKRMNRLAWNSTEGN
ncbi:MAG: redoxin domain-containing protein [Pedosphaera sp.]|nr:redoxin domain-containing protein [Pedosphaera sp.]